VTLLEVRDVAKRFGETWALRGASFSVRSGEVLGLIGPNGSGKTTLLECLAGLLAADAGDIHVNGAVSAPSQRREALFYMPDGITPWPDQTVGWVLSFSADAQGGRADTVLDVQRDLALDKLLHRRVGTLSKGQRRRLLLALALLTPQPLLLLDEPFDGLDLRQTSEVSALLRRVAAGGRTLLLSIHQLSDAMKVCDRLVLLSDGRAVGEGTLAELQAHAGLPHASIEEVFLALT
jgi:ABC-2 type transport system ATP-binding protein